MAMKKSAFVKLVLVATVLSSCNPQRKGSERNVFMRSDTTANYSKVHHGFYGGYYHFMPLGVYTNKGYARAGYYSSAISKSSNIGSNAFKGTVVRGGFGNSGFRASS
jgi:hypothetical protein